MRIILPEKPTELQLRKKSCKFNIENEMDFINQYGWNTEFIGTLRLIPSESNNIYDFSIDKVEKFGKTNAIHALDERDGMDFALLRRALEHDFGVSDYEFA